MVSKVMLWLVCEKNMEIKENWSVTLMGCRKIRSPSHSCLPPSKFENFDIFVNCKKKMISRSFWNYSNASDTHIWMVDSHKGLDQFSKTVGRLPNVFCVLSENSESLVFWWNRGESPHIVTFDSNIFRYNVHCTQMDLSRFSNCWRLLGRT